jgi:hypothetical protein
MNLRTLVVLLLATVATFSGCVRPRTQVVLVIDADPGMRLRATSVLVEGWSFGNGRGANVLRLSPRVGEDVGWPFQTVLTPLGNDATRRYEVSATALDRDGTPIVVARAISGYTPNETRVLRLFLDTRCESRTCAAAAATCREDMCVDLEILPGSLPTLASYQTDAGPADAYLPPGTDAFGLDAWTPMAPDAGLDAGIDAFVEPPDAHVPMGTDAYAPDAFTPDAGTGPLLVAEPPTTLTAPMGLSGADWGSSVAISDDGLRIAVAGSQAIRVWRWNDMSSEWMMEYDGRFVGLPMVGGGSESGRVALNADGTVLAIGRPGGVGDSSGRAWVLRQTAGTWAVVSTTVETDVSSFGSAVALSGDGSHVYVGRVGGFDDIPWATSASSPVTISGLGCSITASHTASLVALGPCVGGTGIAVYSGPVWTRMPGVTTIEASFASVAFGGTDLAVGVSFNASLGSSVWLGPSPYSTLDERFGPRSVGFGASVALSANHHFVVGSIDENAFYLDGTGPGARTAGPAGAIGFGASIAIDSRANFIVVGAPNFGPAGATAYVYRTYRGPA